MEKLKETFKNIFEKFKELRKGVKIAIIVSVVTVLVAIITLCVYKNSNKYKVLFSNLDTKDAQVVTNKLKELKVDTKVEGEKILVPTEKVDELRLELAPEISNGSSGYELMDEGSSFGMTDEEFQIKKLRMIQGELERTIKSFPQVENARVHITPSKDSVFVKDKEPGKASVYLKLKNGEKLSDQQVKAIVSLMAGSTENIPKENIEIVDQDLNLLSSGLYDEKSEENGASSTAIEKQKKLEQNYEKALEKNVYELLEPVMGKNKVKAKINVALDFDSKQKTETVVDPNKVISSQQTLRETNNGDLSAANSESPVDNNMSNTIDNKENAANKSLKEEQKTEYQTGKTESKVISAPGEVKRITSSVVVDGKIDKATEEAIKNIVSTAIGYKQDRGDDISVVGMDFDPTMKAKAQKEIDAMNSEAERNKKLSLYKNIGLGIGGLLVLIIIAIIIIKVFRKDKEEDEHILDMVVGDNIADNETQKFDPIDFGEGDEKTHIEAEIKKYAQEKPDQVFEVIKSWLAENER